MLLRTKLLLLSCILIGLVGPALRPSASHAGSALQDEPTLTEEQKKLVTAARDAVRNADRAVLAAEETRRSADGAVTRIADLVTFQAADDTALRNLEELADDIRSVARLNLLPALDESKTQLTNAKTAVTAARDKLPADAPNVPAEITAARKEANDALERIDKRSAAQDKSKKKLQDMLAGVPAQVKTLVDLFPQRLAQLAALDRAAKHDALLPTLPEQLPDFVEVVRLTKLLRGRWNDISTALKQAGGENAAANAEVVKAIDAVALDKGDSAASKILQNLQPWLSELKTHAATETGTAGALFPKLLADPVQQGPAATKLIADDTALNADLLRLGETWPKLAAQLQGVSVPNFSLAPTAQGAQALADQVNQLNIAISNLQDGLAGDASQFMADQVSLFYFTDVPRVMQMINSATHEVGGIKGAREQSALERRRLTETELDLSEAQIKVSDAQRRVVTLEDELKQTKAAFNSSEEVLHRTTRVLKTRQDDHKKTEDRLNAAKTAADSAPDDAEKRLAFARASDEFDRSTGQLQGAQERNDDATRDRDAAKQQRDALTDEQTGLPAKIQQARADLEAAQAAVVRQRRAALLTAQAESEAFAQARDNTPFWFAPAVATSHDPAKRVVLYAFNDSKTIFLRGNETDVAVVRDIIAQIDRPAPQARLTLWTLEMSSDTSPQGTKNFNTALQIIEEELANNRALTAASLSFLRDCLNDEVNRVAQQYLASVEKNLSGLEGVHEADKYFFARLYFYHPEVRARLGFDEKTINAPSQDKRREQLRYAKFALPDPAGTTTLGETLMVLSLGTSFSRTKVVNTFRANLKAKLLGLGLHDTVTDDEESWKKDTQFFTSMTRVLGLDSGLGGNYEPLTSMQEEIVRALERFNIQRATSAVRQMVAQLQQLDEQEAKLDQQSLMRFQLEAKRRNLVRGAIPLINLIRERYGLGTFASTSTQDVGRATDELRAFASTRDEINLARSDNARIAAADQMLKELIIAVEDDIERHFAQRMINRLRTKITRDKIGVGVGVMQRTSLLATNRLLARVDPRASAQLAVGEEQDILESVRQLSQIILAGQSAGALGVLGALERQPREPPPEIIGLNTGNLFQVTPIFDPSGQALRFKFDFVGTTRIQEPNGSTNRQLPRIERHTVNTEVQLSNLEMREVSRFDSNARIGRPTEYSGGLPIIRDIPKVRPYLPLLGWFVRRGGKAAVVQQSLIFGQTTMYPTISDIMDLLTPPVTIQ